MNICFQAIFNKTLFFYEVSRRLQNLGHSVYWTTTSRKWANWLIARGVEPSRILLLRLDTLIDAGKQEDPGTESLIRRIEGEYGLPLKKIYFMDRIVSSWSWDDAYAYMRGVAREVHRFVEQNRIDVVLGESTSSDEILTAAVCRLHGAAFYHPGTARIPSDRFLFFKDHLQKEFERFGEKTVSEQALAHADDVCRSVLSGAKPNYWYWNNRLPSVSRGFLKKISAKVIEALLEARTDATVKSLKYHMVRQRQYLKPFRHVSVRLRSPFEQPIEGERFVLYTLHKQPEASIDVFGSDHSQQPHLIRQIARHLPSDCKLYVKEHSNALGDRTRKELRDLSKLPGVRLIDPFVDVHDLIRRSEAVLTVSGTVAFEAALYGKACGTFADMYFGNLSTIRHIRSFAEIASLLAESASQAGWKSADRQILGDIIANSHEGVIGDPLSTPVCMVEENLDRVAAGIEKLCRHLQDGPDGSPGNRRHDSHNPIQQRKPRLNIICDSHGAGYGTTGFSELLGRRVHDKWTVTHHSFGGLPVKEILRKLSESHYDDADVTIIQVGNPDVHPRMPRRPLRAARSCGLTFVRDSLFSVPPNVSLRYFLRFPFFLIRLLTLRFHQEFLVSESELRNDFDQLVSFTRERCPRVIIMPVFHVHPRLYTRSHNDRAQAINDYLADVYPGQFVCPRILRPSTYRHYYNRDGFHFIRRYHENVAAWLQRTISTPHRQNRELTLKRKGKNKRIRRIESADSGVAAS